MRTGIANLPLHGGKAPRWLFTRMTDLSREILTALILEYGPEQALKRLADPYWFQAFGCVLGFDWHSSGVTTTVCGAVKEGLKNRQKELGLYVAGGKGGTSRKTPSHIETLINNNSLSLDPENLIYASKMSAKVDNTAVQDGFQLYHHNLFFTNRGSWTVVQQGMHKDKRLARRYHWYSPQVKSFIIEPHAGICCDRQTQTLNLTNIKSEQTCQVSTELVRDELPTLLKDLKKLERLNLPYHHPVYAEDFRADRLEKIMRQAHELSPQNFEQLLGVQGMGPKSIRALALISELIYGTNPSWKDPARYSFTHGGKDGYPYPVDRPQYDQSIQVLKIALDKAKIGQFEKVRLMKKLTSRRVNEYTR